MINNGLTQPTTNGQPVPYMGQPAAPAPQAPPQYAPQPPAPQYAPAPQVPPAVPMVGGGYSGPAVPVQGFNGQPYAAPQPQQQPQYAPQPQQPPTWPPQQPGQNLPGAQPQAPQTPAQQDAILAAVRQYGYDPSRFQSGEELLRTIAESARNLERLPQLEALAQVGARSLGQQNQPQPPAPQQGEQPAWNPPQYDPNWERFLDLDERTGMYVAADPALVHYADQANRFRQWQQSQARQFWQNPYEFMHSGLAPRLQKEFISPLEQRLQQIESVMEQQQLMDAVVPYENQLFAADQQGRANYNHLTPMGNAFNNAYRHSAQFRDANGHTLSVEERVRYALGQAQFQQPPALPAPQPQYAPQQPQMAPAPMYQPAPQVPAQPQFAPQQPQYAPQMAPQPPQQQQDDFLARALERARQPAPTPYGYNPTAAAGMVNSAEQGFVQNPTATFEAQAILKARELGIVL